MSNSISPLKLSSMSNYEKYICHNPFEQLWDTSSFMPQNIYHYCSLDTLKQIIEGGCLRFTDIRYLNDKMEFMDILEIYDKICNKFKDKLDDSFYKIIIKSSFKEKLSNKVQFTHIYQSSEKLDIKKIVKKEKFNPTYSVTYDVDKLYTCSFSLNNDSLLLWLYYSKAHDSCNISFDFQKLKTYMQQVNCGAAIYSYENKESILHDLLIKTNNIWLETKDKQLIIDHFIRFLNIIRIYFKNHHYETEEEFRLVFSEKELISLGATRNIMHRDGYIITCFDLPIDLDAITNLKLSALTYNDITNDSISEYISESLGKKIIISKSTIPMRY